MSDCLAGVHRLPAARHGGQPAVAGGRPGSRRHGRQSRLQQYSGQVREAIPENAARILTFSVHTTKGLKRIYGERI